MKVKPKILTHLRYGSPRIGKTLSGATQTRRYKEYKGTSLSYHIPVPFFIPPNTVESVPLSVPQ